MPAASSVAGAVLARLPVPEIPPEDARRAAAAVLSDPAYRELRPTLYTRAVRWVTARIAEILDLLMGTDTGDVIGTLILVAALLVAVTLLVRLAMGVRRDPERAAAGADAVGRTALQWRTQAAAEERAGRLRHALRAEYRAVVAELAATGLLDEVPGRTSGEYLRAVRRDVPAAAADFAELTAAFERAWYTREDVDAAALTRARGAGARVLPAATRGRVPAGTGSGR